jgi:Undecaprenyl-phosphate glucose phosphotransferase
MGAASRGPLRPEQLTTLRARQARRLGSHKFRTCDVLVLVVLASGTIAGTSGSPFFQTPVAQVAPFVWCTILLGRLLRTTGLYEFNRPERLAVHLGRVAAVIVASSAVLYVTVILVGADATAERAVWWWTGLALVAFGALHLGYFELVRRWRRDGWLTPNVVIVGATSRAEQLIEGAIARRDIHVLGIFDDRLSRSPLNVLGVPLLGSTEALVNHRIMPYVDLIVVTVDPSATARVREITTRLATLPNRVTLLVDQDDEADSAAAVAHLADSPLAPLNAAIDVERKAFAKRMQDLVIAVPLLVVISPLLALIAVAVKLDSPGPAFFRQTRYGFNNEEIKVMKFRTMRQEAADARAETQVTAGDPRVTRLGRILRKSSLDELPQLINVVRDEMSLVGPRPHAVGMKTGELESAQLVAEYAHRHRMKPGMTGWAAINGSRGPLHQPSEVRRRVALDVDYIDRQSFWLDLKIMMLTIPSFFGDHSVVR